MEEKTVIIRTLSRYELLEEIGRGNMGVVYKARDPAMDRLVAIKIIRLGFSLDEGKRRVFLERFHREAQIAGKLSHPHIVAVHDFGSGDEPFIVMEYFPGSSLSKLAEQGPLPPEEVGTIARQLASALAYAHGRGVVHRDVKPANVLYQPGLTKLLDFGVAKLETSELTATGEFMGTPSYMSPEIFSGGAVDARSDLFSLGVVLYQLLTGTKPFEAASVSRTIYRVLHEEPRPPSSLGTGIPTGWDVVSKKLLAKDPAARYPSAERLLEDLAELQSGGAISKVRGRGRARVAVLVLAIALLTFGLFQGPRSARIPSPPEIEAVQEPPPPILLRFVARHEHRVGHCTGDLSLSERGILFETSRHGKWRWRPEEISSITQSRETELELRARSRERGGEGEVESFRFTFLRPALSAEDLRGYRQRVGL